MKSSHLKIVSRLLNTIWVACISIASINTYAEENNVALDVTLIKERVRGAYPKLDVPIGSSWQVMYDGKTENWKLGKGPKWTCPEEAGSGCADLMPVSIQWWVNGAVWLRDSKALKRVGLELGPRILNASASSSAEADPAVDPNAINEDPASQGDGVPKQLTKGPGAAEIWEWKGPAGETSRINVSLRNYLMERIQYRDQIEELEWNISGVKGAAPVLSKVLLEKGGKRVLFLLNTPAPTPKSR